MKYGVTFIKEYYYEVEAENEYDAEDVAFEEFHSDMVCPIADTHYDSIDVIELEEEEEDD